MRKLLPGHAHTFGDHIDTDTIIPARYCTSYAESELAPHAMAGLDVEFTRRCRPGDILVAGLNFGCGSGREHAPIAIKGAGISAIIAVSFSRIFFRNAINIALPVFEVAQAREIRNGEELEIDAECGLVRNLSTGIQYGAGSYPEYIRRIIEAGGLVEFAKQELAKKRN